jgi:hypothetical protein
MLRFRQRFFSTITCRRDSSKEAVAPTRGVADRVIIILSLVPGFVAFLGERTRRNRPDGGDPFSCGGDAALHAPDPPWPRCHNPWSTNGVNDSTRREWDSNPRWVAPHTLSKRADSAALAPLLVHRAPRPRRWRPGDLRHTAGSAESCCLPALTRFTVCSCTGPGRHVRRRGPARLAVDQVRPARSSGPGSRSARRL